MTEKLTDEQVHDGAEYPASLHRREWQQLARELLAARKRIAELEREVDRWRKRFCRNTAAAICRTEDCERLTRDLETARERISELERDLETARADAVQMWREGWLACWRRVED